MRVNRDVSIAVRDRRLPARRDEVRGCVFVQHHVGVVERTTRGYVAGIRSAERLRDDSVELEACGLVAVLDRRRPARLLVGKYNRDEVVREHRIRIAAVVVARRLPGWKVVAVRRPGDCRRPRGDQLTRGVVAVLPPPSGKVRDSRQAAGCVVREVRHTAQSVHNRGEQSLVVILQRNRVAVAILDRLERPLTVAAVDQRVKVEDRSIRVAQTERAVGILPEYGVQTLRGVKERGHGVAPEGLAPSRTIVKQNVRA